MPSVTSVEPLSAARFLREGTARAHADVEALPHMVDLARGVLDAARYVQVLRSHLAILDGWEQAHDAWLGSLSAADWPYRRRTPALRHDLQALSAAATSEPAAAPSAPTPAYAWGMLYVVEGSLLGGRVIARQLRAQQPALAGALTYFDLGSDDPAAWRRFQTCLETVLDAAAARDQAAAGAQAMFGHFHHHLSVGISA